MEKRVTIRDIAAEAGVSTGTVHRAIYGKKGVSEAVQKRILDVCVQRGYRANTAASALKRGTLRIVGAFPVPDGKNRYFYTDVWRGFRRCTAELMDYNIDVIELPYYEGADRGQGVELASCFERYEGIIDALVTVGHFDDLARRAVERYVNRGIPVFLACDDTRDCGRMACVQANYEMAGRMVAELLSSQLMDGGTILVCAGDVLIPSHAQTLLGFERYLREQQNRIQLLKLYGYENEGELCARLYSELRNRPDIRGAFSVSARLSVLLMDAIEKLGKADDIRCVASDVFDETARNLKAGVIRNILYKDPEQQAYLATKLMMDYILKARRPIETVKYVESRIIFRSSLSLYL